MNHQFHYQSEKQAQQWLALHEAYSPARTDQDCLQTYARAFDMTAETIANRELTVISLGCGGGQKDVTLLRSLASRRLTYYPCDVSLPLALTAHLGAVKAIRGLTSRPMLLDLPRCDDLGGMFAGSGRRLFAFFGMLPNFEPLEALQPISRALQRGDLLMLSANLAPGADYHEGVQKILPLYDNELTRTWLATSLTDVGLNPGEVRFEIREAGPLLRVEANCQPVGSVKLDGEEMGFGSGEDFRLFFSYRHTPALLRELLAGFQIDVLQQWITASGEEGVFLCEKRAT